METRKSIIVSEINTLRKELIKIGTNKGLSNPVTIELSQKLDTLLNKYQLIK